MSCVGEFDWLHGVGSICCIQRHYGVSGGARAIAVADISCCLLCSRLGRWLVSCTGCVFQCFVRWGSIGAALVEVGLPFTLQLAKFFICAVAWLLLAPCALMLQKHVWELVVGSDCLSLSCAEGPSGKLRVTVGMPQFSAVGRHVGTQDRAPQALNRVCTTRCQF